MSEEDDQVSVPQTDDVKQSSESSTEQAVKEADSAASVQPSAPDYSREALIKQLTQPDPVEPEPVAEEAEPEAPDEDDESEDEPEVVVRKKPTADDEVLADPSVPDKTKKSITRLRDKAKFGELITEVLTDAKIAPEEFTRWTNLAARLKKGDPTAVTELIATAKNFGYKEPVIAAPVAVDTEPDIDGLTERIYKKEFKDDVDALEITEEVARKHARKAAESAVKSRPVREEPAHSKSIQAPAQMDPIRDRALQAVVNMETQYRATVPNWKDIEAKVAERMINEHSKGDPLMWTAGMQQIVTEEIRKSRPVAPAAKAPIKPINETSIRPQPAGNKSVAPMTDREKAIAMLTGGKIR